MKTLKILLLLLALFPFSNLFSQYFVDQDKIEQLRTSESKYYNLPYEKVGDKLLYLKQISSHRHYYSDIKVGFDKEEYKSSDMIIVTLKRGYENETEIELVSIIGCSEVFSDQVEIQQKGNSPFKLYLKKGQEVKIKLSCGGKEVIILDFTFQKYPYLPYSGESRQYIILYSDRLTEEIPQDSVSNNKLIINNFMIGPSGNKTVPPDTGEKVHSPSISY